MTKAGSELHEFIKMAVAEDIGHGDHSSLSCIPEKASGEAKLLVKQEGILAGVEIASRVFAYIDAELKTEIFINDGSSVKNGEIALLVSGKVQSILKSERLVLNIMQRMSGIATQTYAYTSKIADLPTKILDTRKTTPGMRFLEKAAVRIGGGENHRMGLYDMIMLKDNHIDFAGGISEAINRARNYLDKNNLDLKIDIETRTIDDVKEVLDKGGVDIIMLDNFSVEDTRKAVELISKKYKTESSGGITLETVRDYALCGVDYISVGALTHQIKSLDLSLKAINF